MNTKLVTGIIVVVVIIGAGVWLIERGKPAAETLGSYAYTCDNGSGFTMAPAADMSSVTLTAGAQGMFSGAATLKETSPANYFGTAADGQAVAISGSGESILLTVGSAQASCSPTPSQTEAPFDWGDANPQALAETYTDSKRSFSIKYPADATSSPVDYSGYLPLTKAPLASFTLPASLFAGTNLAEAGVYIGASAAPAAINSCTSAKGVAGETAGGTETLNGADFSTYTALDAGAGNFYTSKIYRRIENGWCVEMVELLHSTDLGNYPPGTVTAFDQAKYEAILDSIAHSYQSIPTGE